MKDLLKSAIDLSESRLKPYEGFIFLCGGPTDVKEHQPISIRDAIQRELVKEPQLESRIRIAEHYKDWAHDSIYSDLISFEKHLAELSSVIVLVLESEGSIAELGLFSAIEEFRKKLLVFIDTNHYITNSFIKLGPVNFLEKVHDNAAECHRWNRVDGRRMIFDPSAASDLQPELAEAIRRRASKPVAERIFQPDLWLDGALLACDLISLCSALTLRELRSTMVDLGCNRSETDVKQLLFVLERVQLIAMEPKGDQRFFISRDSRQFLKFHMSDTKFDLDRFRSDLLEKYEKEDRRRFRAIQEARRRYVHSG